jgi:hypothetical protein
VVVQRARAEWAALVLVHLPYCVVTLESSELQGFDTALPSLSGGAANSGESIGWVGARSVSKTADHREQSKNKTEGTWVPLRRLTCVSMLNGS